MLVKWSQGWDKGIEKEFSELRTNKEQKSKMRLTKSSIWFGCQLFFTWGKKQKTKNRTLFDLEQFGINILDILHIWSAGELAL